MTKWDSFLEWKDESKATLTGKRGKKVINASTDPEKGYDNVWKT